MTSRTIHEDPRELDDAQAAPRTEQVRIVGAERAAGAVQPAAPETGAEVGTGPATDPGHDGGADEEWAPGTDRGHDGGADEEWAPGTDRGHDGAADEEWAPGDAAVPAEPLLPHWTEAPTGEIPAILSRGEERQGGDPWASLPEPTWREERRDWEEAEQLAPSFLAGHDATPSLLAEADEEERQPWSFDLGPAAAGRTADVGYGGSVDDLDDLATDELFVPSVPARAGREQTGGAPGMSGTPGAPKTSGTPGAPKTSGTPGAAAEDLDGVAGERTTVLELPGPEGKRVPAEHVVEVEDPDEVVAEVEGGEGDARRGVLSAPAWLRVRRRGEHADAAAVAADAAIAASVAAGAPHSGAGPTRSSVHRPEPGTQPHVAPRRGEDPLSQRAGRNIPAAIVSGVVIGGLALVAFHFGTVPSMVVVTAVLAAAAVEAYAAFRRTYRPATLLGIVAVVGVVVGSYDEPLAALPVVAVLLFAATVLWHLVGVDRRAEPVRSIAATLLVFSWIGVFGSFAALLLAPALFPNRTGIAYLLGALIAAVAYDVGALVAGAWVGRHPLSRVSPGKTWEGVLGGAVGAIVFAVVVVRLVHPWTLGEAAVLGVVVAVVSPIGDLCESLVKRQLGLKDMGRILPGHGGLLDRVDGLLFVLPAAYYLVRAFGHG
jgi:CDP-diglyceride synthetase